MSNGRIRKNWEVTALELAFKIADCRSEDPYKQVGSCAIYKQGFRVCLGYNGAPSGIELDWSDREEVLKRVLHSETNVLNWVQPGEIELLAITHIPCSECIKVIAQKQIKRVVYSNLLSSVNKDFVHQLAKEYKIDLKQIKLN